tara:strand:- start:2710 stop:3255 length:546 start_codon:yes stop_codon:yes gene_type:complete
MPKVKYTDSRGLEQLAGSGVELDGKVILGNPSGSAYTTKGNQPSRTTMCFMWQHSDASTVAEHKMTAPDGSAIEIPPGFVCVEGHLEVVTAVTSGGSLTMTFGTQGTSNDPDGFVSSKAKAVLTQYSIHGADGALVSGSHTAQRKYKRFITTSDAVSVTIGTAASTAGKVYLYLDGYMSPG